ncbi:acyltransferase family protein [Candidatus Woesearchaeota archaeon]|nr:acyltransferase family protein [Candidatus Woesearchaeota archaeon]
MKIGYIQKFFTRERSDPYRLQDMLSLSLDLALQPIKEIAGYHKRLIKRSFLEESEQADWAPFLYNTLQGIIFRNYFRPEAIGAGNIPDEGAMFVANHSGMWGIDGIALKYVVFSETGRTVTGMSDRIFDGSDLAKTMGMVTGTKENAKALLEDDRLILVCPGGGRAVAKKYGERYKVQRTGGFARGRYGYLITALDAGKPIVPVGIVGAEETHIILGNIKPQLDRIVSSLYDSLPEGIRRLAEPYKERWDGSKTFPLMLNPVPFPSRIQVRIGKPINFHRQFTSLPWNEYPQLMKKKDTGKLSHYEYGILYSMDHHLNIMNEEVIDRIQALIDNDIYSITSRDGEQCLVLKFK